MRVALKGALFALAAGAAQGCSVRALDAPPPEGSSAPSASAAPAVDERALAEAGRGAIEAAQAVVGERCEIDYREVGLNDYEPFDACPVEAAAASAYGEAVSALEAAAAGVKELSAVDFVKKSKMFRDWLDLVGRTKDTRGTAAFYQGLALAYNAWRPGARVWVDPPRIVDLEFGVVKGKTGGALYHYLLSRHDGKKDLEAFRASGKTLVWRFESQGVTGPYRPPP